MTKRSSVHVAVLTAGMLSLCAGAQAVVIYDATAGASAVMGYINIDDPSLAGTQYNHPDPLFSAANVIDGDLTTQGNTYSGTEVDPINGNDTAPLDFVGVLWNTAANDIVAIRLHHFLFFDGGSFGTQAGDTNALNAFPPNNAAANAADAADVAAPTVQVTTDGGLFWVAIAATENYVSVIQPEVLAESGSAPPPVTFEFAPQSGIDGLRLVGYGGGRSDIPGGRDEQGFIAVREFEVGRFVAEVPEPGSAALLALGAIAAGAGDANICANSVNSHDHEPRPLITDTFRTMRSMRNHPTTATKRALFFYSLNVPHEGLWHNQPAQATDCLVYAATLIETCMPSRWAMSTRLSRRKSLIFPFSRALTRGWVICSASAA